MMTSLDGVSPPSPCSTYSDRASSSESQQPTYAISSTSSDSDNSSDIDESELGEFLLDAFEEYDPELTVDDLVTCN